MKYIDDKFKNAKEQMKKARELKKMFSNPTLQEKIQKLYQDYFEYNDYTPEGDWDMNRIGNISSCYGTQIQLYSLLMENEKTYEELVDKATYISYDNKVIYEKKWETTWGDYSIFIQETYFAPIPEDEMVTLEALGKVEVEYHDAYKETRIYCNS